jgi:hypothetical protein
MSSALPAFKTEWANPCRISLGSGIGIRYIPPVPTPTSSSKLPATGGPWFVFLFMTVMALACLGAALVLGTEPRMDLRRTAERTFEVTGANSFAGVTFYSKTIQGATGVTQGDADRDRLGDSTMERRRQRERKHLAFAGEDGTRLRWDGEGDQSMIEAYMRGTEPTLALRDPAPLWRKAAAWLLAGFGLLVWSGGIGALFKKG